MYINHETYIMYFIIVYFTLGLFFLVEFLAPFVFPPFLSNMESKREKMRARREENRPFAVVWIEHSLFYQC